MCYIIAKEEREKKKKRKIGKRCKQCFDDKNGSHSKKKHDPS